MFVQNVHKKTDLLYNLLGKKEMLKDSKHFLQCNLKSLCNSGIANLNKVRYTIFRLDRESNF